MWWVAPDRFNRRDRFVGVCLVRYLRSSCDTRVPVRLLDRAHAGQTSGRPGQPSTLLGVIRRRAATARVHLRARRSRAAIRKVGAPLGVIIALGTLAGLIVILLTAVNPVGTAIGFVLATVAMTVVVLAYLWLDRWEPEPPRLLVFAFLWGASVAVVLVGRPELVLEASLIPPGDAATGVSPSRSRIGAPLIEEAAKGAVPAAHDDRPAPQRTQLADRLPGLRGLIGAGFAWLENILYIANGESLGRVAGHRGAAADHGAVRSSAVHHDVRASGCTSRCSSANAIAKVGCILLGYAGAVVHARAVERLVAARCRDLLPGLRVLDGAGLRAGDHAGRHTAGAGNSGSSPPNCPAWWPRAW